MKPLKQLHIGGSIALFLLFSFLPFNLSAQSQADSLQQLLKTAEGTERAELLLKLSWQTRQKDVEAAIAQAQEALEIAERFDNEELKSSCFFNLGFFYQKTEKDTTALAYYLSALKLKRQLGLRDQESSVLHNLGYFYRSQGNHSKALQYYFQALRIRQAQGLKKEAASVLFDIGDVYFIRREWEQAASAYERSVALSQEAQSLRTLTISGVKAGNAHHKMGHSEKAAYYFELALEAAKKMNSIHAQGSILLEMSSAYKDQKLYEKALMYNLELLGIAKSLENNLLLGSGFKNLAGIYRAKGELMQSNAYLLKAQEKYEAVGKSTFSLLNKMMKNHLGLNQPGQAIKIGEKALARAKKTGSLRERGMLLETLIKAYEKQGSLLRAMQMQSKLIEIKDQIHTNDKNKRIAKMQVRFETEQKEQEIKLLEKEKEKATLLRNGLFAGIALILFIALLIFNRQRLRMRKNKTDMENTLLKDKQLEQDLEFKNKQLTTHSLNLVQKNEVMKELKQRIAEMEEKPTGKSDKNLRGLNQLIDYSFNLDKDWEEFKHYFEEVHTGFFAALKKRSPELTSNELRLSALIKLNLTIKEISSLLAISPDSVKIARHRLRKKLNLDTKENLSDCLSQIEQKAAYGS